jgi:hypothetical protein
MILKKHLAFKIKNITKCLTVVAISFLIFTLIYNLYHYNCYYKFSFVKKVTIQPILVFGNTIDPIDIIVLSKIASDLNQTKSLFFDETNIKINWLPIKIIHNDEFKEISCTPIGNGEINDISSSIYEKYPNIIFCENILDMSGNTNTVGITARNKLTTAVIYDCGPKGIMHELCHVFGLYHYYLNNNIMYENIDKSPMNLNKPQIGKMKRKIHNKNWDD